jgi:hypothetical protein
MKWKLTVFCLIASLVDVEARRIGVKPIAGREVIAAAMKDAVPGDEIHDEIWQVHKTAGFYDRVGVNLFRAGAGNRILSNHLVEVFDGINLVATRKGLFEDRTRGQLRPNFTATHNVVAGGGRPWPGDEDRETGSLYLESLDLTDRLTIPADHAAAGSYKAGAAAESLPGWEADGPAGAGPLPAFPNNGVLK